jgi:hypothetical protein
MYIGSKSLAIVVGYLSKEWITFVDSKFVGLFVKLKNKIENKNKLLMAAEDARKTAIDEADLIKYQV